MTVAPGRRRWAWLALGGAERTMIAAAILVSAHMAFWRITLDDRFDNAVIEQHAPRGTSPRDMDMDRRLFERNRVEPRVEDNPPERRVR